jgi:hypothetical protein
MLIVSLLSAEVIICRNLALDASENKPRKIRYLIDI